MSGLRRIQISLVLMLLHLTATAGRSASVIVRDGDEVALPCENVRKDQNKCDRVSWIFTTFPEGSVELVSFGQISKKVRANKSVRLSVTQNCSLVIKKVTDEDAGQYTCRQFEFGIHKDTEMILFTVIMTERKNNDQVVWSCSVLTYRSCPHTVKWLFNGTNVDKDHKDLQTSQSDCSASVTFQSSHFIHTSNSYHLLKCEVTDGNKVQHLFPFRLQPSGEKPGDDTTTTTESSIEGRTTTTATAINDALRILKDLWWLFIIVAVVLVALIITVVKIIRCKRATGKNTRMNDDAGLTSNSTVAQSAPETSQDTADPEDGVSYASVIYTKKPNSKGQVQTKHKDDEDDAVTYMAVKVSSTDPSSLYARIN